MFRFGLTWFLCVRPLPFPVRLVISLGRDGDGVVGGVGTALTAPFEHVGEEVESGAFQRCSLHSCWCCDAIVASFDSQSEMYSYLISYVHCYTSNIRCWVNRTTTERPHVVRHHLLPVGPLCVFDKVHWGKGRATCDPCVHMMVMFMSAVSSVVRFGCCFSLFKLLILVLDCSDVQGGAEGPFLATSLLVLYEILLFFIILCLTIHLFSFVCFLYFVCLLLCFLLVHSPGCVEADSKRENVFVFVVVVLFECVDRSTAVGDTGEEAEE
eukprot:gene6808-4888_t